MICAMVYQLTRNLTPEQIKASGFDTYFVDHTASVYPIAASGLPWRAEYIQSKGDIIADLHEDMSAEQKARVTYDNLIRLIDDPDILDPLKFLRQREIVHYQRFGEANLTHSNRFIIDYIVIGKGLSEYGSPFVNLCTNRKLLFNSQFNFFHFFFSCNTKSFSFLKCFAWKK